MKEFICEDSNPRTSDLQLAKNKIELEHSRQKRIFDKKVVNNR